MRRFQLFEFNDQAWCPFRDTGLDLLRMLLNRFRYYHSIVPQLRAGLEATGATRIVDLCSGGGGPWPSLMPELERHGLTPAVLFTDLFPNQQAFSAASREIARVRYCETPVDATAVPAELGGFRTLFTAFHHFPPEAASAILADAVRQGVGIGIFEFTWRMSWPVFLLSLPLSLLGIVLLAPIVLLAMPFLRPRRPAALFFTYVIPLTPVLLPLIAAWDGMVSALRTYAPAEMLAMARAASEGQGADYRWVAGGVRCKASLFPVSYLVGVPAHPAHFAPWRTAGSSAELRADHEATSAGWAKATGRAPRASGRS